MSKRLFALLATLMVASMLLAACGGGAAPAEPTAEEMAAEEPTAEESVAEEPTEEPAMAEDEWGYMTFAPGTEIKIGVSAALTGGYAQYGQDIANGVELATEVFGDLDGWTLTVEAADDGCEGAPGVTVAEQFSADPDLLAVVGPMCTPSTIPASDIYDENHVVMITASSTAIDVTNRGLENLFRTVANDGIQAGVIADYLANELDIKTLGLIHDQSSYGEPLAEKVGEEFKALGGSVTSTEGITRGDVDFSAVVSNILADDPESIFFGGMDAEGALLVKQLRDAGFEGVFFGPDGLKSQPTFVDASGGAAEGAYMTFGAVGGATGYDEFETLFTEKYGEPIAYSPNSYDAALIILNAAKEIATVDDDGNLVIGRKALADQIRSTPYNGITGALTFTDTGDLGSVSVTVFQVIDNEITEVKKYDFGE